MNFQAIGIAKLCPFHYALPIFPLEYLCARIIDKFPSAKRWDEGDAVSIGYPSNGCRLEHGKVAHQP